MQKPNNIHDGSKVGGSVTVGVILQPRGSDQLFTHDFFIDFPEEELRVIGERLQSLVYDALRVAMIKAYAEKKESQA